jgi:hypothetical protein
MLDWESPMDLDWSTAGRATIEKRAKKSWLRGQRGKEAQADETITGDLDAFGWAKRRPICQKRHE